MSEKSLEDQIREIARSEIMRMFGSFGHQYNIDNVVHLAHTIDSSLYVAEHMKTTARFNLREDLMAFALKERTISGLVLEFGVFQGASINYIASLIPAETIYGFDSFEGLPEPWLSCPPGAFKVDRLPDVCPNVKLIAGWFNNTLPTFIESCKGPISLLHIDCDLYSSTKTIFEALSPQIVPGTIIVFDEYINYPGWRQDEHKAFMEHCGERSLRFDYIGLVPQSHQVAVRMT